MKAEMLLSQFDDLEAPSRDEAIRIAVDQGPDDVLREIFGAI
ncbi:MAG: hypothetical protein R3335_10410 [Anaerolineales bacterium]|nr:hypothetical protein [Anaerolineales bacterium]